MVKNRFVTKVNTEIKEKGSPTMGTWVRKGISMCQATVLGSSAHNYLKKKTNE